MIATRFKTVGWVACVATAALGCYLVSLRVASERNDLIRTERALLAAREDIRGLQTELNTRSRLVQLERWNADVLALTAPKARQYLTGEMQLASLATTAQPQPAVQTADAAALQASPAIARVAYAPVTSRPATRLVHSVSLTLDGTREVAFYDAGAKSPRP